MSTMPSFESGIFASLFDFQVSRFATPKLIRILYVLGFAAITLFTLIFLVVGLSQGGIEAFIALVVAPVAGLLYLLMLRVYVEVVALLFRMGADLTRAADALTAAGSGPAPAGGQPPTPPPPGQG